MSQFDDVRLVCVDVDGTVSMDVEGIPIEGAAESLQRVAAHYPVRFVTNATSRPHAVLLERLIDTDFPVTGPDLFTPATTARAVLDARGHSDGILIIDPPARQDFGWFQERPDGAAVLLATEAHQWKIADLQPARPPARPRSTPIHPHPNGPHAGCRAAAHHGDNSGNERTHEADDHCRPPPAGRADAATGVGSTAGSTARAHTRHRGPGAGAWPHGGGLVRAHARAREAGLRGGRRARLHVRATRELMTTPLPTAGEVTRLWNAQQPRQALTQALTAWRASRDPVIAEAVAGLDTAEFTDFSAPRARTKVAFHKAWLETAEGAPTDRGVRTNRLSATPPERLAPDHARPAPPAASSSSGRRRSRG